MDRIEYKVERLLMSWDEMVREKVAQVAEPGDSFTVDEVYAFESEFREAYPGNQHVLDKIRQCLQHLRDAGVVEFIDNEGNYRRVL